MRQAARLTDGGTWEARHRRAVARGSSEAARQRGSGGERLEEAQSSKYLSKTSRGGASRGCVRPAARPGSLKSLKSPKAAEGSETAKGSVKAA